jgi:MYXO-CTERM domain-containing protein
VLTNTTSQALSSIDCTESQDTGYTSGKAFAITVVTVDGKKVEKDTANAYYVMAQAAAADGVNLAIVSGFRTMAQQQQLYSCYVNCSCNNCNLAAKPGYSNHQSGHALDLNTSASGVLSWLNAHGASFGFKRTVPSENWHWEWWGGGPGGGPCGGGASLAPLMGTLNGSTSTDIDGDKTADACARAAKGVVCSTSGDGFASTVDGPALSDQSGWNKLQYFGTLRMGDIDADGRADLCARAAAGVSCWLSDGSAFPEPVPGPAWSDAQGFDDMKYWSTMRLADVNGDAKDDLCIRTASDFRCHPSSGKGFGPAITGPALSNASGWGEERFYATLRMADVNGDGKADVCARASAGFSCWLSDGEGFSKKVPGPELSDASGWGNVEYWSTIHMADVNGDGKADVCARAAAGVRCWLSDGAGLLEPISGPELSDAKGWNKPEYYSTLRFADLDGDGKADVCARSAAGLRCWLSDGQGFPTQVVSEELSDAKGWNKPEYYSTIRVGNANGDARADVCARGAAGVFCWQFDGTGFSPPVAGPEWTDAGGWNKSLYYSTLQVAGGCVPSPEICNQADDDCDGEVDEDDVCGGNGTGGSGWSGGGGIAGSAPGSGGNGASSAQPATEGDDAGCACRAPQSLPSSGRASFVALLGLAALGLFRRRQSRSVGANKEVVG